MHSALNPYAPLRGSTGSAPLPGVGRADASCIKRGWISRTIRVTGTIEAEIRYYGGGFGERVYVDGVLAARTPFFTGNGDNVTPHIDFTVTTPIGTIPAAIDVTARMIHLLRISEFSLTLLGTIVYAE